MLIVDVDRLQEYVFATAPLREVRGASALLSRVEEEVKQLIEAVAGGQVQWLTVSGGTLRAVVDMASADAEQLALDAAAMYLRKTGLATASGASEPFSSDDELVGAVLGHAEHKLRTRKNGSPEHPWFPSHPLFCLCDLCGQFPATGSSTYVPDDHARWLLCDACSAKSKAANQLHGQSAGPMAVAADACTLASAKIGGDLAFITPDDLGGLVARRKQMADGGRDDDEAERRYIGVIYGDANGMGETWKRLCDDALFAEDFAKVSQGIGEATSEALAQAVAKVAKTNWDADEQARQPAGNSKVLPFIPLIVGGDDVVCVVPAAWALDVAQELCSGFSKAVEGAFEGLGDEHRPPAMAAGVVLCKHKFPIQHAMGLAKQLLRSAKGRCRDVLAAEGTDPGAIDFAVVSESGSDALGALRQQSYTRGLAYLTERPYLASACGDASLALDGLLEAARRLGSAPDGVPRSKWKRLDHIVRLRNDTVRKHEYEEWVGGLSRQQHDTWGKVCRSLQLVDGQELLEQRTDPGGVIRTGIIDMIEVADILERGR